MIQKVALLAAGILIGVGAGYLAAPPSERSVSSSTALHPISAPPPKPPTVSPPAPEASSTIDPTVARNRESLYEIVSANQPLQRTATLIERVAEADLAQLTEMLDAALAMDRLSVRNQIVPILYSRWAEFDPAAAAQDILDRREWGNVEWISQVYFQWAAADTNAAIEHALSIRPRAQDVAISAILEARDDLSDYEREQLAIDMGRPDIVDALRQASRGRLIRRNPEQAWQDALMAGPTEREARVSEVLGVWAYLNPEAAAEAFVAAGGLEDRFYQSAWSLSYAWASIDAEAALEWARGQPPGEFRRRFSDSTLSILAQRDAHRALELANALPEAERWNAIGSVLGNWPQSDARTAARQAATMGLPRGNDGSGDYASLAHALGQVGQRFGLVSPEEAFAWATEMADNGYNRALVDTTAMVAASDAALAGRLVEDLRDPTHYSAAMGGLVGSLSNTDPEAAAAILNRATRRNPDGVDSNNYSNLVTGWALRDLAAAQDFVETVQEPRLADAARYGLLISGHLNVEQAERHFMDIRDPTLRQQAAVLLSAQFRAAGEETIADRLEAQAGFATAPDG